MATHFSFPSIEQFRNVVKTVQARAKWNEIAVKPKITFSGTVKLHGTNGGIVLDLYTGEIWAQSRERILTLEQDNAGFCQWFETNKEHLRNFLEGFGCMGATHVAVYGEWCGGNIQTGVAINGLPKMFVAFKIRLISEDDSLNDHWIDITKQYRNAMFFEYFCAINRLIPNLYTIADFPTYSIEIDFEHPELSQNELVTLTEQVEAECPVGREFGKIGVGEGIVWSAISCDNPDFNISGLIFKVKGEKHSSSKVRTLAAVDVELIKKIDELVDYLATDNRLKQGLDVLKSNGVDTDDSKNTKLFIDWVRNDVIKEEKDVILKSELDFGKVMGKVSSRAGQFYNTR
jgi:hypothetical protein